MSDTRTCANAAKAFVVHDGKALVLRRRDNDVHGPGQWDIPGGRLNDGEDPYDGVRREAREEASIAIDIEQVIDVQWFTRDDEQHITMMIFACSLQGSGTVRLSEEHVEYRWVPVEEVTALQSWLAPVVGRYQRWMCGAA
ncbi:MAG: NUDIX domain-containing protein [bacterium]|nr:NUDIX domain-containing protein [bacterium]